MENLEFKKTTPAKYSQSKISMQKKKNNKKKVICFCVFTSLESFEFMVNMQRPIEDFLPSMVCVGPC